MIDEKTIRLLQELLSVQPQNWEARTHLARLFLEDGKPVQAEAVLSAGGELPEDPDTQLLLGAVLGQIDRSRAIAHYLSIVHRDRTCAPAYLELARLYRTGGMDELARRNYGIATVIDESLEDPEFRAWYDGEQNPASVETFTELDLEQAFQEMVAMVNNETASASETHGEVDPLQGAASLQNLQDEDDEVLKANLPRITFRDVGGMEDVKERIRMNIIYPSKNAEVFKKFKKRSGGGILLYGPPGCGKTYLARATAGECEARFIPLRLTDVLSKYIGESESRLHETFEAARRFSPSIVFIDEVDALGMSRRSAGTTGLRTLINQFLVELDGLDSTNESLMILGATNVPWEVDMAFRRPGRFDRVIFVPPPDREARKAIFSLYLEDIPAEILDLDRLAKATKKFSGADIRAVVELASDQAIAREMRSGRPSRVTMKMLLSALKEVRPTTLEWLETAKSYASYSNRGGQYDDLVQFFEEGRN